MENNEVMEIMETEVNAENEEVLETEAETNEVTSEEGIKVNRNDYAKKVGMAVACSALGAIGTAFANEVVIPLTKKAIHKGVEWIKSKINKKNKTEEPAEEEVANETEAPKETKKKAEKK